MNIVTKILAGLGLLAVAFAAGWLSREPEVQVQVETKTETKVVEVEKVVTKIVKETATKPDGTTTTTETTTTTADTTTTKEKDKTKPQPAPVAAAKRDWSVGVQWRPDFKDPTWVPASATVGYRVTGPVWAEAGVNFKDRAAIVGVRVEF
jgi:hypothetical protein